MSSVLVVDDQASNRELVRDILTYRGHHVIEAREGSEALRLALAEHPDLVLTDMLMPGMDGYELAEQLRATADTARTPIVFLTANYLPAEVELFAQACGINKVLLKSVDPQGLIKAVEDVLADQSRADAIVNAGEATRAHAQAVSAKLFERSMTLAQTEARFQLMADHSPVGTVFGDRHGSANYVNERFAQILGLAPDDLLGLGWLCCVGEDQQEEILAVARGQRPDGDTQRRYRGQVYLPDDSLRWLNVHVQAIRDIHGAPDGFIATIDDVTAMIEADQQRRAAERRHDVDARIRATERLQSLSRLAGGVAHDFNNILCAILAFESFVSESITELGAAGSIDPDTSNAVLSDLEKIRNGCKRATDLTQQLLTFGSGKHITVSPLDLNHAIRESNDLLAPAVGDHINIATRLAPDLRPILAEAINIGQILLNLTLNARDAMPSGGTLTIATANSEITGSEPGGYGLEPGHYARLTVRDTGTGMTPEILDRALEPFFTTKPKGQASGLGLATVYGIVNQLGGGLRIESTPRRGTVVTIHLPATDQPVQKAPPAEDKVGGGSETILVADDEDGIRDIVTRSLARAGYTVLAAASGAEALALATQHPQPIDLLLSDVVMPGMGGPELADELSAARPGTKVLFMSGYADGLMNERGGLPRGITVLPKPFDGPALLTAVRTAIAVAHWP